MALDRDGLLDDPDYLKGLTEQERERYNQRNVFPFSLSVAAHEVLQLVGLVADSQRVGGVGAQHYAAYPGEMTVAESPAARQTAKQRIYSPRPQTSGTISLWPEKAKLSPTPQ